jgi:hypothetical protein
MMVEQLGNMFEKASDPRSNLKMLDPTNSDEFTEEDKQKMLKEVEHAEWSGLPKIHYCCMNAFTTKYDEEEGKFTDFKVQELHSNIANERLEFKYRVDDCSCDDSQA